MLNAVALAEIPGQSVARIQELTPGQRDKLARYAKMGVDAVVALMEFSYPKLARISIRHYSLAIPCELGFSRRPQNVAPRFLR